MYQVGDRVQLAPQNGGFEGFVTELIGGPENRLYRVQGRSNHPERARRTVAEGKIIAGPGPAPVFSVGRQVTIDGFSGTVTADNGDGTYDVDVRVTWNQHLVTTRRHRANGWELAIWSPEG